MAQIPDDGLPVRFRRTLAALGVIAVCMFIPLAFAVEYAPELQEFDKSILDRLHTHALQSPQWVERLKFVSDLGSPACVTALTLVALGTLGFMGRRRMMAAWFVVLVGTGILISQTKLGFERPRPQFIDPLVKEASFSFPSGHSAGSMVCYGMLAYCVSLATRGGRLRVLVMALLAGLVLLIGFSRIYLGAHYPSDVLGGFCMGSAWMALWVNVIERIRKA